MKIHITQKATKALLASLFSVLAVLTARAQNSIPVKGRTVNEKGISVWV